ncbi:MAG TPA: tetraacyldisaccharide 4'-kinase [Stellaceae bacterium]|nr:tetraacyldisaccharide 4'-kinase [Stellaceae bacterium]
MILRTPNFWGERAGLVADVLLPLGVVWDAAGRLRRAVARPWRAPLPVVCVGNLMAGGAGKTPVTLALAGWLVDRGIAVHIVSRGHGGSAAGPLRVNPAIHDAAEVGDEALLLAARAPAWVARNRASGVAAAAAAGAAVVLLDDGLQNPAVAKTLALLVIDAGYGFGNGRVMPAGPLRENLRRGLARADAAVLLSAAGERRACPLAGLEGLPVVPAVLAPVDGERFAGRRVFAFAGIGRPEKFFATLRRLGAELVGERGFPDHFRFRDGDLVALRSAAAGERAQLVTTAKDWARLPPAAHAGIEVLQVETRWPDPAALAGLLTPVVRAAADNGRDPERHSR